MSFVIASFSLSAFNSSIINAKAQDPTEIISLRSEYGKQFDNGNGTITSYINTVPIHYWNNGEWIEIDNSLILDENGNYTNKSSSFNITIPSKMTISNNFSDYDSDIQLEYDEYKLSISLGQLFDINNSSEYVEAKLIEKKTDVDSRGNIPRDMKDSFEKVVSSVEYDSICDGTDLFMDIRPDSFCESFYFEKDSVIPDSVSFFVNADGLFAKKNENNEITFEDASGNPVFTIPVPVITDSSCESMGVPVDVDITENDNGYYISLYLNEPANEIEDPVYPLILNTSYVIQPSVTTHYISEYAPNSDIYNQYIKVGNVDSNGFQTYVSCGDSFTNYSGNVTITNATFNMYIIGDYISPSIMLSAYSINSQPMYYSWNNSAVIDYTNNSLIRNIDVANSDYNSWKEIDIHELVQLWLNYGNTSQNVGIPAYGFKIIAPTSPCGTVVANSERANYNQPYFQITYIVNSDYTMYYADYKYNNNITNKNFQNRMNCYAYALQIYFRGYFTPSVSCYKLSPGEIGIGQQIPNMQYTSITNYDDLEAMQGNLSGYSLLLFTDEQMKKDAQAMGFNITNLSYGNSIIHDRDSLFNYIQNAYNDENGRLIALVAGTHDVHYYLRHGNGTCTNPSHGSNCSIWSHKPGVNGVTSQPFDYGTVLCDETMYPKAIQYSAYYSGPWFYNIDKTTNVYNAWFYDGHNSANTSGTSFVYLD